MFLFPRNAFSLARGQMRSFFLPTSFLTAEVSKSKASTQDFEMKSFLNSFENSKDIILLLQKVSKSPSIHIAFSALSILSKWNEEEKINFKSEIENHESFPLILDKFKKHGHKTSMKDLYYAIMNLYSLEVESNSSLIESLQNDLLWHIQSAPVNMLVKTFLLFINHQDTDMEKEILKHTVNELQNRCKELRTAWGCYMLYEHSEYFSTNFMNHLDDRVLEISEHFTTSEIVKTLLSISKSGRRPKPLIRSFSLDLLKKKEILTPEQICTIFYVLCKLNVLELPLISKLCADLSDQMHGIKDKFLIGSFLCSLGHARFREPQILDLFTGWIDDNFEKCSPSTLISFLLTLAYVSYTPPNSDALFDKIISELDITSIAKDSELIDTVWALVVLDKVKKEHISLVLEKFPSIETFPSDFGLQIKLLNIDASSILIPNYDGKRLKDFKPEKFELELCLCKSKNDFFLNSYVISSLENFLPRPKYMRENLFTPMGIVISAVGIIGQDGKAIPLSKYLHADSLSESLEIPKEIHKIAIMTFNFKDYTVGSQMLTGPGALALKILRAHGYKVVEIPYWSVDIRQKGIKSVAKLERKIKKAIED